jgi:hypothetical protein
MNTKVIERVRKLLALSENNPSDAEAQSALLKAQQFMAEHNIAMDQVKENKKKPTSGYTETGGCKSQWQRKLAHIIADNFKTNMLLSRYYGFVFIGYEEDVHLSISLFNYTQMVMKNNMRKLRAQTRKAGLSTEGISGDYCLGFLKGLRDKFREQVEENEWGLVVVKSPEVIKYTEDLTAPEPVRRGRSIGVSNNLLIFEKGYQEGKGITLQKQL